MKAKFPDFIANLPEADLSVETVTGTLLTGSVAQAVFLDLGSGTVIPPHSHGAQWGIVVSGAIDLTIDGKTCFYGPGDSYFVGEGVVHSAVVNEDSLAIDVFADNDRYLPR